MKNVQAILAAAVAMVSASAFATPCDQVQSGIDAKIKAKGVTAYTLDVVAAADVKDQKVVGSCEGGSKKIVYSRKPAADAVSGTAATKS
jgi:hypothetical protein